MTVQEFNEFCLANRDLRIERTANGAVIIMPPAFSDTGNRNLNITVQLANWSDQEQVWDLMLVRGLRCPIAQCDRPMQLGLL